MTDAHPMFAICCRNFPLAEYPKQQQSIFCLADFGAPDGFDEEADDAGPGVMPFTKEQEPSSSQAGSRRDFTSSFLALFVLWQDVGCVSSSGSRVGLALSAGK